MEKYFRQNNIVVDSCQIADEIKTCILLLNRIIADDYYDNVFIYHNRKWGKLGTEIKNGKRTRLGRINIRTKKDELLENKESGILWKHTEYLEKQDIEYLFFIMKRKIKVWWD